MQTTKWNVATLVVIVAIASAAIVMAAHAKTSSGSAETFVKKATIGGMFEVESSKIALQKTQNPDVKQFAQTMIDDHGKASDELKATVPQSSVSPDKIPAALDSKHQKMLDKLKADSASNFDRDYIKAQADAHKEAVSLFRDYSQNGDDAALKDFAGKTLPTLEQHQQHVEQLKAHS